MIAPATSTVQVLRIISETPSGWYWWATPTVQRPKLKRRTPPKRRTS